MTATLAKFHMNHTDDFETKLIHYIVNIAICGFNWNYLLLVVFHHSFGDCASRFIKLYGRPLNVVSGLTNQFSISDIKQFVLFIDNVKDFEVKLLSLARYKFNNSGRYIILCNSNEDNGCSEIEIMKICWKYKMTNIVYVNKNSDNNLQSFSYNLFSYGECNNTDPVRLETYRSSYDKIKCIDYFPKKYTRYESCSLTVSTFLQPPFMNFTYSGQPFGVDGDLLLLIAEALNATLKVMTPVRGHGWGLLEDDGKWSGSLGDIYEEIADFSMTSSAVNQIRYSYFQISSHYNSFDLVWVTRPTQMMAEWLKIFMPYGFRARIVLNALMIILAIAMVLLKYTLWNKLRMYVDIDDIDLSAILYAWMSCMGLPFLRFPKNFTLLFLILLWIWMTFLLRNIYQAALASALKTNKSVQPILTLHEAMEAEYLLGGSPSLMDYYKDDHVVYNNWVKIDPIDIDDVILNISKGWNFVLALNIETGKNFLSKHRGERQLHILHEKVLTSPIILYFKKYSPFFEPINSVLMRLVEGGFAQAIYRNNTAKEVLFKSDEMKPLGFKEFEGCLLLLTIGYIISGTAFIIELIWGYMRPCIGTGRYSHTPSS